MSCLSCGQGFHTECAILNDKEQCCGETSVCKEEETPTLKLVEPPKKTVRDLVDPKSTIRKAASKDYPLDRSADCEWRLKGNVGGGKYPIVGCLNGKQQSIHHGPEKIPDNAANSDIKKLNREGNVHRVCHRCHNLWHAWNDGDYSPDGPFIEHAPILVALEEIIKWSDSTLRPKPPVARAGSFAERNNDESEVQESGGSTDELVEPPDD